MPILYYVELAMIIVTSIMAASFLVTIVGAGLKQRFTIWIVIFLFLEFLWSALLTLIRFILGVDLVVDDWLLELSAILYTLMSIVLFGFAVRYAKTIKRSTLAIVLPGVAIIFLAYFIQPQGVIDSIYLTTMGYSRITVHPTATFWGFVPGGYLTSAFLVFMKVKNRQVKWIFASGIVLLLTGYLLYNVPETVLTMMPYFNFLCIAILGYAVLRLQIFNPLTETTEALQHEVAERQRVSEALAKSEANLTLLSDTLYDMVLVCDQRGTILHQNQRFIETMRDSPEKELSDSLMDYVVGEYYNPILGLLAVLSLGSEDQTQQAMRLQLQSASGEILDADLRATYGMWNETPVVYLMLRDITEQLRAEAEIHRLSVLLEHTTIAMPSALVLLDDQDKVLMWNPQAVQLTGIEEGGILNTILWETCPPVVVVRESVHEVRQTQQPVQKTRQAISLNDREIYYDALIFPVQAEGLRGVVLRIDDVSDRVQMADMMYQSAKMASVGRLAAGVAHEINNPLAGIVQGSQVVQMAFDIERKRTLDLLAETGVDPQSFQSYLEKRSVNTYLNGIRESGARASRIVSDLLAFSRRSMSKFAPRNINSLVQQILALAETDYSLREQYDFRDVQVELDLHSGDLTVICDGQQIQQVMLNLLRNAVQAMNELALKQPDYVPQLRISTQDAGESVRLVIADNGPGVPEDVRERLFEPFMTTKEVGQGTGLGLWMSWSIINERHQGRIWLEEASENGSVFVIELPKNGPEDEF